MNSNIRLVFERLEVRNLLTADMVAFQNPLLYQDVNFDQFVSQIDALQVINHINGITESEPSEIQSFFDVDGDEAISGVDALRIINNLNGVEVTNQSVFEQIDDFVDEIERMDDLIPADLVQISQDVVAEMQSQSARLTAMRTDLEEFLKTPRHDQARIADRLANIRLAASEFSEDILSDLNNVNGDAVDQHVEQHDLHKLEIHQLLHDKFTEVRELKRQGHKWEDYLPHGEVTQQQVDHQAARLEKAFGHSE